MTKTEFKAQSAPALKAALLDLFDDEDGSIEGASKTALNAFVDENWAYIDSQINMDPEPEAMDEPAAEAPVEMDLSKPNPATNLHYGPLPS